MKQLQSMISLLFLVITHCTIAQPNAGDNLTNPNLDKFTGVWKYTGGNMEIVLELKKVHYLTRAGFYDDILMGVHSYTSNGIVIEDYLNEINLLGQTEKGTFFLSGNLNGNPNVTEGTFTDRPKAKQGCLVLVYTNGGNPNILLNLSNFEGPTVQQNGAPPFDDTFTIPRTVTLIRQ